MFSFIFDERKRIHRHTIRQLKWHKLIINDNHEQRANNVNRKRVTNLLLIINQLLTSIKSTII